MGSAMMPSGGVIISLDHVAIIKSIVLVVDGLGVILQPPWELCSTITIVAVGVGVLGVDIVTWELVLIVSCEGC